MSIDSKEEACQVQKILYNHANEFWFLEDEVNRIGSPAMVAAMQTLHVALGEAVAALGLNLPVRQKSGGGGK